MIHFSSLAYVVGMFLLLYAVSMLPPLATGLYAGDAGARAIGWSLAATLSAGALLAITGRRRYGELSLKEGLLVVVAVWLAAVFFGALPFYLSPYFRGFVDAFFESMSGLTTTGATVLEKVEVLPDSLQFWRMFSHWIGGMGIVLLGVAILPLLGLGGMHLYRAEFSGARSEKLTPRIAETAAALWKIYVGLTLLNYAALRLAGMGAFEALLHAFSTLGTGGFSTRTPSIAGFNSPVIEYVTVTFMLLAGINFAAQYRLWVERQPRSFFGDIEVRMYFAIVALASVTLALTLREQSGYSIERAFRSATFQVASIITTTGYVSDDFELWPPLGQLALLALMFTGGCTGSTAGGLKVSRMCC